MSHEQVAQILAYAAVVDNRQVDEITIAAWHKIIGHLRYDDAIQAVTLHRRESPAYLEPAHIVAGAKRVANARYDAAAHDRLQGSMAGKKGAPPPRNMDAMSAAWNDPVEFAKQVAIYNRQLKDEGYPPLYNADQRPR